MGYEAYGIHGHAGQDMKLYVYSQATGQLLRSQTVSAGEDFSQNVGNEPQNIFVIGMPINEEDMTREAVVMHSIETINTLSFDNEIWWSIYGGGDFGANTGCNKVLLEGYIYLMGGALSTTTVRRYDIGNKVWESVSTMPVGRNGAQVGVYDGEIYMVGGGSATLYKWNPTTDTYTQLTSRPVNYGGETGTIYEGFFYTHGGRTSNSVDYNTLYAYDISQDTWEQKASGGSAVSVAGMCAEGGYLYIQGGRTAALDDNTNAFYRYNISTNSWQTLATGPAARMTPSLGGYNGYIYLSGGFRVTYPSNYTYWKDLWRYDPSANTWTTLTVPLRTNYNSHGGELMIWSGVIYATGGSSGAIVDGYKI